MCQVSIPYLKINNSNSLTWFVSPTSCKALSRHYTFYSLDNIPNRAVRKAFWYLSFIDEKTKGKWGISTEMTFKTFKTSEKILSECSKWPPKWRGEKFRVHQQQQQKMKWCKHAICTLKSLTVVLNDVSHSFLRQRGSVGRVLNIFNYRFQIGENENRWVKYMLVEQLKASKIHYTFGSMEDSKRQLLELRRTHSPLTHTRVTPEFSVLFLPNPPCLCVSGKQIENKT